MFEQPPKADEQQGNESKENLKQLGEDDMGIKVSGEKSHELDLTGVHVPEFINRDNFDEVSGEKSHELDLTGVHAPEFINWDNFDEVSGAQKIDGQIVFPAKKDGVWKIYDQNIRPLSDEKYFVEEKDGQPHIVTRTLDNLENS